MLLKPKPKKFYAYQPAWGKATAGGGTTTFNPADKAGNMTLSNGNLTQTGTGSGFARTVASHSTGKFYCEYTGSPQTAAYNMAIGVANASAVLTNGPGSPDTNSLAYYNGDPAIYAAGAALTPSTGVSYGTSAGSDVICMAVDIGAGLVWMRLNNGNWNGSGTANPATATGGLSFTLTGALFAIGFIGGATDSNTFNFGGTAYTFLAPSGFGNW